MASRRRRWNAEIARWRDAHPWRHGALYGLLYTAGGLGHLLVMRLGGWSTAYDVPTILALGALAMVTWGLLDWLAARRRRRRGSSSSAPAYEPPRERPPTLPW